MAKAKRTKKVVKVAVKLSEEHTAATLATALVARLIAEGKVSLALQVSNLLSEKLG